MVPVTIGHLSEEGVPVTTGHPSEGLPVIQFVPCKAPATAAYRYICIYRHEITRSSCSDHDPVPGNVGCYTCRKAGREEPMTWQVVELAAEP